VRPLLVCGVLPLTACEYVFRVIPAGGPLGGTTPQYEDAQLRAVLPDCGPAPVHAQLQTVAIDRKTWDGSTPVDSSSSAFPFTPQRATAIWTARAAICASSRFARTAGAAASDSVY
jgi:hypothetical protein